MNFLVLFIGEHLMDFGGRLLPCQRLGKRDLSWYMRVITSNNSKLRVKTRKVES